MHDNEGLVQGIQMKFISYFCELYFFSYGCSKSMHQQV
jgi:hypothetical protein